MAKAEIVRAAGGVIDTGEKRSIYVGCMANHGLVASAQ